MNGISPEKTWFVYLVDHHEGPFTLDEIRERLERGLMTPANYVWRDGMIEWKVMTSVEAFIPLLGAAGMRDFEHTRPAMRLPNQTTSAGDLSGIYPHEARPAAAPKALSARSSGRMLKIGSALLLTAGIASLVATGAADTAFGGLYQQLKRATLERIQSVSFFSAFISPIPSLEGVSPQELEELRAAARHDAALPGSAIGIAHVTAPTGSLAQPEFYVSANLSDGSSLVVMLEGVGDTLIGATEFFAKQSVVLNQKLAKTKPFKSTSATTLPPGQYRVLVIEGATQPPETQRLLGGLPPVGVKNSTHVPRNAKLFGARAYFLGGNDDLAYRQKLREYHESLKQKAQLELAEIKQFVAVLEGQLAQLSSAIETLSKERTQVKRKRSWAKFSPAWNRVQQGLSQTLAKLPTDHFYESLYKRLLPTATAMTKVFQAQEAALRPAVMPRGSEIKVAEWVAFAENALRDVKSRVNQTENLPPTANGMPQREGNER